MDKTTGLTHLIKSTQYSMKGLKSAVKYETAFRHELFCCIFMIPLALWLGDDAIEKALMIGSVLLVLVVDRIGTERHELSGRAKDQGSAAVFVALVIVVVTWGFMLFN